GAVLADQPGSERQLLAGPVRVAAPTSPGTRNFDPEGLLISAMPTMRKTLGAALLAALVLAAPAAANQTEESIFQDDGVLQQSGADAQTSALKQIKDLGADTVHVLVGWRRIAPSPDSRTKPPGFDASDPASYPAGAFDSLDSLVRQARADGLDVIFTP